jgi:hypothetical protein
LVQKRAVRCAVIGQRPQRLKLEFPFTANRGRIRRAGRTDRRANRRGNLDLPDVERFRSQRKSSSVLALALSKSYTCSQIPRRYKNLRSTREYARESKER